MGSGESIRNDVKLMRISVLLEPEIARMFEAQAQRTHGADEPRFDSARSVVTYVGNGHVIWEARAELIGSYLPVFGLWRWWWSGRIAHNGPKISLDLAFAEGQRNGITAITSEQSGVSSESDAQLLSNVCAILARADGAFRLRDEDTVSFYALFDTGRAKRASMLPGTAGTATMPSASTGAVPSRKTTAPQPPSQAVNVANLSLAPAPTLPSKPGGAGVTYAPPALDDPFEAPREPSRLTVMPRESGTGARMNTLAPSGLDPRAGLPVREPSREIFLPVAQVAFSAIHGMYPNGFHQGLLVIVVDASEGRARFSAVIVASDEKHDLTMVESPRDLIEAVSKMIAADARSGNGPWRRLTARLSRTTRGASVEIVVT